MFEINVPVLVVAVIIVGLLGARALRWWQTRRIKRMVRKLLAEAGPPLPMVRHSGPYEDGMYTVYEGTVLVHSEEGTTLRVKHTFQTYIVLLDDHIGELELDGTTWTVEMDAVRPVKPV